MTWEAAPGLIGHALVAALALAVAGRDRSYRVMAAYLAWVAVTDLANGFIYEASAGITFPPSGTMRLLFHGMELIPVSWSLGLLVVLAAYHKSLSLILAATGVLVAASVVLVSWPTITGEELQAVLYWTGIASIVGCWAFLADAFFRVGETKPACRTS